MTTLLYILTAHSRLLKNLDNYPSIENILTACSGIVLVSDFFPHTFPENLKQFTQNELPASGEVLIKDMRDSTKNDIEYYRNHFKTIITIDDSGEGDTFSDLSIKLLPVIEKPYTANSIENIPFLYGYHFFSIIENMSGTFLKDVDICVYTDKSKENYPLNLQELASSYSICVFNGNNITPVSSQFPHITHYIELLLRSKVCVSHFGISLFEAMLCGAQAISINPTEYHSTLADNAASAGIINCGMFSNVSLHDLSLIINATTVKQTSVSSIISVLFQQTEKFFTLIKKVI